MAGALHNPKASNCTQTGPTGAGAHCLGLFFWLYLYLVVYKIMLGQCLRSMVLCQVHQMTCLASTRDTCLPFSSCTRKRVIAIAQAEGYRPLAYWYDQGCIVALTRSVNPFLLQHLLNSPKDPLGLSLSEKFSSNTLSSRVSVCSHC